MMTGFGPAEVCARACQPGDHTAPNTAATMVATAYVQRRDICDPPQTRLNQPSRLFGMWDALRLDVRHAFRSLRRAPTFSAIVVVTLTLAVGATTAVGSLLNAIVLRRLAVPSPKQLVALSALEPRANVSGYFYADTFEAYRSVQRSFAQMSMYSGG